MSGGRGKHLVGLRTAEYHALLKDWGFSREMGTTGHAIFRSPSGARLASSQGTKARVTMNAVHTAAQMMGVNVHAFLQGPPKLAKPTPRVEEYEEGGRHYMRAVATAQVAPTPEQTRRVVVAKEREGSDSDLVRRWMRSHPGYVTPEECKKDIGTHLKNGELNAVRLIMQRMVKARQATATGARGHQKFRAYTPKESEAQKRSAVVPVGRASTIDEVLTRSNPHSQSRRVILQTLVDLGGKLEGPGNAVGMLWRYATDRGLRVQNSRNVGALVRTMERDGQLGTKTEGRRIVGVYLLDPVLVGRATVMDLLTAPTAEPEPEPPQAPKPLVPEPEKPSVKDSEFKPAPEPSPPLVVGKQPSLNGVAPNGGTLLEVKFSDKLGRIFLETDDGRIAVADKLRWV